MFLVCDEDNGVDKYYQIWTNNKDQGFDLAQLRRFPKGLQSVTFGDIGAVTRPNSVAPSAYIKSTTRPGWYNGHALRHM